MISVEQVRALEERVERAVSYIAALRSEKSSLADRLERAEAALEAAETQAAERQAKAAELGARIESLEGLLESSSAKVAEAQARAAEAAARAEEAAARADEAAARAAELEAAAEAFRSEQGRIEEGIVHALRKLDAFEDLVLMADAAGRVAPPAESAPLAAPAPAPAYRALEPAIAAASEESEPERRAEESEAPLREASLMAAAAAIHASAPEGDPADELSMEELEALTAPEARPEPASPASAPRPAETGSLPLDPAIENELDIF